MPLQGLTRGRAWKTGAAFIAASVFSCLAGAAPASAHPALLQASPTAGLIAPESPSAIGLALNEEIVASGSEVELSVLAGDPVKLAEPTLSAGDTTLSAEPVEPLPQGVYEVRWSALGTDGHVVSGRFAFGVAGKDGEPPDDAQALVAYGSRGGSGDQEAAGENVAAAIATWIAVVAASFLFGGFALLTRLGRRAAGTTQSQAVAAAWKRWRVPAPGVWLLLLLGASGGVLAQASAGAGDELSLSTALDSASGRGAVIVFAILLALTPLLALGIRRPARGDFSLAAGGFTLLMGEAFVGHVQSLGDDRGLAIFVQAIHLLSAGIWFGGLLSLLVVTRRGVGAEKLPLADAARGFAPLAAGAFTVSVVTGAIVALREVDDFFFLRWSSYGNIVAIKAVVVLLAGALGGFALWRATRSGAREPGGRVVRFEAATLGLVVVLAAALSGLVPGRDQVLPAERGDLLVGPRIASGVTDSGPLRVTLAPARAGANTLSVVQDPPPGKSEAPDPKQVSAFLECTCSPDEIETELARGDGGTWGTDVELPADGPWFARISVDGEEGGAVALPTGVPEARGPEPLQVLAVADLDGADAERCRNHLLGVELGVGRLNALGGLDGGRKLALLALDDGDSPEAAFDVAADAIDDGDVLALAGACGANAGGSIEAARDAGIPAIVADPGPAQVEGDGVFRVAGDPYAEGVAAGGYINDSVLAASNVETVRALETGDAANERMLAGLESELTGDGKGQPELERISEDELLEADPAALADLLDNRNAAAFVLDGEPDELAHALASLGPDRLDFPPTVALATSRLLSERLATTSGGIGRLGAIQGLSEVLPDTAISQVYSRAVTALYPGERPTLDGLRGYVGALALSEAVEDGIEPEQMEARLEQPEQFADTLLSPWRSDAPGLGSQRFIVLGPSFLPQTLVPTSAGGSAYDGTYFTDGAWTRVSEPLGPPLAEPLPPLADSG